MAALGDKLTESERKTLAAAEAIIEENLGVWVNVSNALLEVSERRLYRETHPSFEAYVADRWGISRSRGHRIVVLGRVRLSPIGHKVRNEAQARELASLLDDPELLVRVVDRAEALSKGKRLTARALRQARMELLLPPAEAAKARTVYEVAEWTRELAEEWEAQIVRWVAHFTEKLPPELWEWAEAEFQTRKRRDKREHLRGLVKLVAYDAPLTPEVASFLAASQRDRPLAAVFSGEMEALGFAQNAAEEMTKLSPMFGRPDAFVARISDVRSGLGAHVGVIAARMAEVVTAAAQAPALRTWTPEEVEVAREEWIALCDSASRAKLGPGPLLDQTRGGLASVRSLSEKIRARLEA